MNNTRLAIQAALEAGKEILKVYSSDFSVDFKEDRSPLTQADRNAHTVIINKLASSSVPVLSEEGKDIPYDERKNWNELWIVDPLDGTKEFISRNGEFTVNIAFVRQGKPVMGVIYRPLTDELFWGEEGEGAFKLDSASAIAEQDLTAHASRLPLHETPLTFTIVASRSHLSPETKQFIDEEEKKHGKVNTLSSGSSLKLCMIAENKAHVYPRFAPTMEWDTAAGHAIVKAAGKNVYLYPSLQEMHYNKPNLRNEWFIAR